MDRGETNGSGEPDPDLRVVRASRPSGRRSTLTVSLGLGAALVVGVLAAAASFGGADDPPAAATEVRSEVSIATTTLAPTTTEPQPDGPVAPLTGIRGFAADAEQLSRPALVVKVDNDPRAFPQQGLGAADLVVELRVEGISRFMAVYQSSIPERIGPVRSARTSDPDLLAMLSEPLFAWSGGNAATVSLVRDVPWIRNVGPEVVGAAYSRTADRRAPHNLVLDPAEVFDTLDPAGGAPTPVFSYRSDPPSPGPGGRPPGDVVGVEVGGFDVPVGSSLAGFAWSAERSGWLRWTNGEVHTDGSGQQLAPANVVVLETDYVDSGADRRSPEAVTLGSGRAWVFTAGRMIEGTWTREDRFRPWSLRDDTGAPIALSPGSTWVELPERGRPPTLVAH